MKITQRIIAVSLFFVCLNGFAQESNIFIPVNQQKAIKKGTRTTDGTPGKNYFQNKSDYTINVRFNPFTAELNGKETIVYYNNSSDTLKKMVIRLYPNLFKPETVRQVEIDTSDYFDGVDIQKITINGNEVSSNKFRYIGTNLVVPVPSGINPNASIKLQIHWKTFLPNKTHVRMGRYDTATYFVAFFYPQIAVYDDIAGWSLDSYSGLYEFYNDYSNFDVTMDVPENCMVWATGELQNTDEIFQQPILSRITKAKQADTVIHIITNEDFENQTILKKRTSTEWHFKANNVPDFAFGVSDNYIWDGTSVMVDSTTKRRASVNAVYKKGTTTDQGVAAIGRETIHRLSTDLIGIAYPYPQMTVWEGDGGMEFPMMCNDGPSEDTLFEVFVTSHEISHSYFPFMVGTNETLYGWIDEGLITFIPKVIEIEHGNTNAHYYIHSYCKYSMGNINDIPMSVPTTHLTQNTYFVQNYGRAAAGFYFLHDMLGDKMFAKVLQTFIQRWESKHPTPTDLFFTLNAVTHQDWAWYWNPWFYEYGYADLALENVQYKNNKLNLSVRKKGSFPVPVKLIITFDDNSTETVYQSALVWKNNSVWKYNQSFTKKIVNIELGDKNVPDAFLEDNSYRF